MGAIFFCSPHPEANSLYFQGPAFLFAGIVYFLFPSAWSDLEACFTLPDLAMQGDSLPSCSTKPLCNEGAAVLFGTDLVPGHAGPEGPHSLLWVADRSVFALSTKAQMLCEHQGCSDGDA